MASPAGGSTAPLSCLLGCWGAGEEEKLPVFAAVSGSERTSRSTDVFFTRTPGLNSQGSAGAEDKERLITDVSDAEEEKKDG